MRLRPITDTLPKPLCPVGNVPLIDLALARLAAHGLVGPKVVAVNTCYLAEAIESHVDGRAHLCREPGPEPLGTSGALWQLRNWIAGRAVLVLNTDAYLTGTAQDLAPLLEHWDGHTARVLTVPSGVAPAEFDGGQRFAGVSLLPADMVAGLPAGRSHLVLTIWRPAERAGRLETRPYGFDYADTGTPGDYLAANMRAAGGRSLVAPEAVVTGSVVSSVVGAKARVAGSVTRCVVLPGATVSPGEALVDAVRIGADVTLDCRAARPQADR